MEFKIIWHSQFVEDVVVLLPTKADLQEEKEDEGKEGGGENVWGVKWHRTAAHPPLPLSTSSPCSSRRFCHYRQPEMGSIQQLKQVICICFSG